MSVLIALHKPHGYLSQFKNEGPKRNTKKLLNELGSFPDGIMAIGRLDEDSEGLLLLCTDGKISEYIRSAKVEKSYWVEVDGNIHDTALEKLRTGVQISTPEGNYTTKPCLVSAAFEPIFPARPFPYRHLKHGPTSWISISLREGKFRQIRKMTAAIGFPTIRLIRYQIGSITLGNIKAGEYRVEDFQKHFSA